MRQHLAAPLGQQVFFVGEATHRAWGLSIEFGSGKTDVGIRGIFSEQRFSNIDNRGAHCYIKLKLKA
jgi:hypothetical protein